MTGITIEMLSLVPNLISTKFDKFFSNIIRTVLINSKSSNMVHDYNGTVIKTEARTYKMNSSFIKEMSVHSFIKLTPEFLCYITCTQTTARLVSEV